MNQFLLRDYTYVRKRDSKGEIILRVPVGNNHFAELQIRGVIEDNLKVIFLFLFENV